MACGWTWSESHHLDFDEHELGDKVLVEYQGISWAGIPVKDFDGAIGFFRDQLGIPMSYVNDEHQAAHFRLANDDLVEVFGPDNPHAEHRRHVVVALKVEDINQARIEMERRGVNFLTEIRSWEGEAWCYFEGPDGLLFEIQSKQRRS